MADQRENGPVGLPIDAAERARLLDEAGLTPAERQRRRIPWWVRSVAKSSVLCVGYVAIGILARRVIW